MIFKLGKNPSLCRLVVKQRANIFFGNAVASLIRSSRIFSTSGRLPRKVGNLAESRYLPIPICKTNIGGFSAGEFVCAEAGALPPGAVSLKTAQNSASDKIRIRFFIYVFSDPIKSMPTSKMITDGPFKLKSVWQIACACFLVRS